MLFLKKKYFRLSTSNKEQYKQIVTNQCSFLFNHYTNIFNRLFKDQLDITILQKFIYVLSRIEEGEIDQHEGSYEVGELLKKMYIDSALRQNKQRKNKKKKPTQPVKKISWKEYKTRKIDLHL